MVFANSFKTILRKIVFHGEDPAETRQNQRSRQFAEERKQVIQDRPDPLPPYRLNLSNSSINKPSASNSEICSLLTRFPFEIRRRIYEFTLGGNRLLLHHEHKHIKLRSEIIPLDPPSWASEYRNYRHDEAHQVSGGIQHLPGFPLLLTCRQIYMEAVSILYDENIFDLDSPLILVYLAERCLRPQRLKAIRHLGLNWRYFDDPGHFTEKIHEPYDFETWEKFWNIVAFRLNLQSLNVRLEYVGESHRLNLDGNWVQPMLKVKDIGQAQITIDWLTSPYDKQELSNLERQLEKSMMQDPKRLTHV